MAYKQPYTGAFWSRLGQHLGDVILREKRPVPKCVVLDADNTLWGGVVGEDGIGGIELSSTFPGIAFQEFQRVLKGLRHQGVLLAVASKNNHDDVIDSQPFSRSRGRASIRPCRVARSSSGCSLRV